jgi:hypothetical protein
VANTFAFVRTGTTDGLHPTGWDLASESEDPQNFLYIPWIQVRKGLPASLEIGANAGWIGATSTGVLGVYGRWSVVEGYRRIPDVALQLGYAGYIGNDELELGIVEIGP